MKEVIVASRSPRGAAHVRSLLAGGQVLVRHVFTSAAQVLAFASVREEAVVVCGRLPDMPAAELARLLPVGFDVVWLVSPEEPPPAFAANLVPLQKPVDRAALLDTVRRLASAAAETGGPHRARDPETEAALKRAKAVLRRAGLSERDAHRELQRRAMQSGKTLLAVAEETVDGEFRR